MDDSERIRNRLDELGIEYDEIDEGHRTRWLLDFCERCGDHLGEIELFGACVSATRSYITPELALRIASGSLPYAEKVAYADKCGMGANVWHECTACGGLVIPCLERYCKHCGARLLNSTALPTTPNERDKEED